MKENMNEVVYEQAKFYKIKLIPVHITLNNGFFYNGIIMDISTDFLIISDEKIGEFPIWFKEIKRIEPRKVREV